MGDIISIMQSNVDLVQNYTAQAMASAGMGTVAWELRNYGIDAVRKMADRVRHAASDAKRYFTTADVKEEGIAERIKKLV